MKKYTRVHLSRWANSSRSDGLVWHPQLQPLMRDLPGGNAPFWGIPFELPPWSVDEPAWILLREDAVQIPLAGQAGYVVLAHFCDADVDEETGDHPVNLRRLWMVSHPGEHLADYVLIYADGTAQRQPIRRRFEIHAPGPGLLHQAFMARPHQAHQPVGRPGARDLYGSPDPGGAREPFGWPATQMGLTFPHAQGCYWIYALPCAHPEKELAALRLEPVGGGGGPPVAVAGLTLYHGRHHPLRHRRLETLRVTLPAAAATAPSTPQVTVDLGIIARLVPAPAFDPDRWLASAEKGWGEDAPPGESISGRATSTWLVDLSASPAATLVVQGRSFEMEAAYSDGAALTSSDSQIAIQVLAPEKSWLQVTVIDGASGCPTAARLHFRSADGRYLPPAGHPAIVGERLFEDYGGDVILGSTPYAYVDGRCQIELPVGEVYVEIAKGFEYMPARQKLRITPGQRELQLRLERAANWRRQGWVTADPHVHALSPQAAWLQAQAEGLNMVAILALQLGAVYTNVADITGELSGVSRDDTLVWVGTENRQHLLGHISLIGTQGQPVLPLSAAGPGESYFGDPVWDSMAGWADAAHARGGLAILPHFGNPHTETIADIILGKADAVELRAVWGRRALEMFGVTEWYRVLNCGYRIPAVGGTDKLTATMAMGSTRTYAYLGERELTYANWAAAVRAGNTFATSGPLLQFQVEGHSPGEQIWLPGGGGKLAVAVQGWAILPFHGLELVMNGRVVERKLAPQGTTSLDLQTTIPVTESGWMAARCVTHIQDDGFPPERLSAHTSPVYVVAGGQPPCNRSDAAYLDILLEGGIAWLDTLAIPADPARHEEIRQVFRRAQAMLGEKMRG